MFFYAGFCLFIPLGATSLTAEAQVHTVSAGRCFIRHILFIPLPIRDHDRRRFHVAACFTLPAYLQLAPEVWGFPARVSGWYPDRLLAR